MSEQHIPTTKTQSLEYPYGNSWGLKSVKKSTGGVDVLGFCKQKTSS